MAASMSEKQKQELLENFRTWSAEHPRDWQEEIPYWAEYYVKTDEGLGMDVTEIIYVLQNAMDPTKS